VADLDLYAVKQGRTRRGPAAGPGELRWAIALARAIDEGMACATSTRWPSRAAPC